MNKSEIEQLEDSLAFYTIKQLKEIKIIIDKIIDIKESF